MIWTLISTFSIVAKLNKLGTEKKSAKQLLLQWVNSKTQPEKTVENFKQDWNDGSALLLLTNAIGNDVYGDAWTPVSAGGIVDNLSCAVVWVTEKGLAKRYPG